jgi:hypothetical protein
VYSHRSSDSTGAFNTAAWRSLLLLLHALLDMLCLNIVVCVHCAYVPQEPDACKRRELVDTMCQLEERMQAAVTALHITAAKLLLALGTHIVIPKPHGGRQSAGQKRLGLGKFIQRLTDVSSTAHSTYTVVHAFAM